MSKKILLIVPVRTTFTEFTRVACTGTHLYQMCAWRVYRYPPLLAAALPRPVRNRPRRRSCTRFDRNGEGSTTVVYTDVWHNSVVWCTRWNPALWLAGKLPWPGDL